MIAALLTVAAAFLQNTSEEPFCAVTIEVRDSNGTPLAGEYRFVDITDKTVASGRVTAGRADACDLDFGFFTLKVMSSGYYATRVEGVHLVYGESQRIEVVLNRYRWHGMTDTRCLCYFRVKDRKNEPIQGVEVTAEGKAFRTDRYGRVQVQSPSMIDIDVRFEKKGFLPVTERINCRSAPQKQTYRYVVLESSSK